MAPAPPPTCSDSQQVPLLVGLKLLYSVATALVSGRARGHLGLLRHFGRLDASPLVF